MLVAMLLEGMLRATSAIAVVKAARVLAKRWVFVASTAIDFAILDINLAGEPGYPVAEQLRQRGIPFVFASGYDPSSLPADFHDIAVLRKPYMAFDVQQLFTTAIRSRG